LTVLALLVGSQAQAEPLSLAELARPGRVLMLRHALAPGNGDPPGFRIEDCSSQRNLDQSGRQQARALGRRLSAAGMTSALLYSSQWCRCLETARLLDLGPVVPLPALNSFYGRAAERGARVAALRTFLAQLPVDGRPVVLVTHQITISQFTQAGTASGGGSLFQLNGTGEPVWLGTIAVD
jgi:broad specificity phosphatase PhoE